VTESEKSEVQVVMKGMLYFGLVEESTHLHGLLEKLIKAQYEVECLLTMEQRQTLDQHDLVREYFPELGEKRTEALQEELKDWEDKRFFKH